MISLIRHSGKLVQDLTRTPFKHGSLPDLRKHHVSMAVSDALDVRQSVIGILHPDSTANKMSFLFGSEVWHNIENITRS